jgi:hypothetical protein
MEGAEMLARGAVGHNNLWYHRDAIEAYLAARDAKGVMRRVKVLETYVRAEQLLWSTLSPHAADVLPPSWRENFATGCLKKVGTIAPKWVRSLSAVKGQTE